MYLELRNHQDLLPVLITHFQSILSLSEIYQFYPTMSVNTDDEWPSDSTTSRSTNGLNASVARKGVDADGTHNGKRDGADVAIGGIFDFSNQNDSFAEWIGMRAIENSIFCSK